MTARKAVAEHWAGWLIAMCTVWLAMGSGSALAQAQASQGDNVEEIVVTGERSLRSLRLEVEMAQEAVFDIFNEIYADTDYEMICTREKPIKDTMNPIPNSWSVRVCRSRLAQELHEQQMEDFGEYMIAEENGEIGILVDTAAFQDMHEVHREELFQKSRDLIVENSEYREKVRQYAVAKTTYDAAVEADFAKGNIFTRLFSWGD